MLLTEWQKQYLNIRQRDDIPIYGQALDSKDQKKLEKCDDREIKEYQSIVGQITWLASNTRPDLVHFTSSASRAAKDPIKGHSRMPAKAKLCSRLTYRILTCPILKTHPDS